MLQISNAQLTAGTACMGRYCDQASTMQHERELLKRCRRDGLRSEGCTAGCCDEADGGEKESSTTKCVLTLAPNEFSFSAAKKSWTDGLVPVLTTRDGGRVTLS